jgi:hypothetical protein
MTILEPKFSKIQLEIAQERLRQARYSFNLALMTTAAFAVIGMSGFESLLAGRFPESFFAIPGGISPIFPCIKFAREANSRLDSLFKEMNDDE